MKLLPPCRGIIFDMDGVLCDSEPLIAEAAGRMFREKYGAPVQPEDFQPFIGTGEARFLGGVAEKYGVRLEPAADKARTYAIYLELIRGRLRPLPGALDFVADSRARGLRLAVATSADRVKLDGNLREIGLSPTLFDALVTGSEVPRKKPHPDIFLRAAEKLGLPPADCLVVEDAPSGLQAGRAAGCRCLGLTTSFAAAVLTAAGANWIAADLEHARLLLGKLDIPRPAAGGVRKS
ncbi:MAG: HAD-IA family hydrolase [Kiritimatiellaeota bacterium]|nr:HAD-IA family hydrolase [Kiritimatiellota bacterium]